MANKKFRVKHGLLTEGDIANVSGNLTIDSPGTIRLDSSQNIDLYANGTHFAYLQNENSDFRIGPIIADKDLIIRGNDGGIYKDALKIDFSEGGHITPGADNTQDFGSNSKRWRNIYSADLQLSNVDTGGNDVDGSEGSWTIQEGENDLFIINRKNGKKYKFNLEEVE